MSIIIQYKYHLQCECQYSVSVQLLFIIIIKGLKCLAGIERLTHLYEDLGPLNNTNPDEERRKLGDTEKISCVVATHVYRWVLDSPNMCNKFQSTSGLFV